MLAAAPRVRVSRLLRQLARAVRRTPERLLHPMRRHRALQRLRRNGAPASVLFVCHGNICRSPYAAAVMQAALPSSLRRLRITSAGFIGAGRPVPPEGLAVAGRLGVDLSGHRSAPLTASVVGAAQLVIVMDADQRHEIVQRFGRRAEEVLVLGDCDPQPIDTRTIRDPVEQPVEVFEATYARIDRCISQLLKALSGGGRGSRATPRN